MIKLATLSLLAASFYVLTGSEKVGRRSILPETASISRYQRVRDEWSAKDAWQKNRVQKRNDLMTALREDLAAPWKSVVVAHHYMCSCTGTQRGGFEITRNQGTVTQSVWGDRLWYLSSPTPAPRSLSKIELDAILSEARLHFLTAMLMDDPLEAAGPRFENGQERPGWRALYIRAGGFPTEPMDHHGIEIQINTPDGLKTYVDLFSRHAPHDFGLWMHRMMVEESGKTAAQ